MENYRIWIAGANGKVGSALCRLLERGTEYELLCTDVDGVNVTDAEAVMLYADMNRPDFIINCAGITDPGICERNVELAYKVNALGARNLSVAANKVNAKMIQLSTDDVFDGRAREPYNEFDFPAPYSVYGKSKLAGENFVREMTTKHIIVRSSWVYGIGEDYVNYVLGKAEASEVIFAPENEIAVPTSAKVLAQVVMELAVKQKYGIYHVVCKGSCSRFEFAREILHLAGMEGKLCSVKKEEAMRPAFTVLDNLMMRISDMKETVDWKTALREYMKDKG